MTKPIHPRPSIVIKGEKVKRKRRTKSEMFAARLLAQTKADLEADLPKIMARLALATPQQIRAAERTMWRWSHPRY